MKLYLIFIKYSINKWKSKKLNALTNVKYYHEINNLEEMYNLMGVSTEKKCLHLLEMGISWTFAIEDYSSILNVYNWDRDNFQCFLFLNLI